MTDSTDSTSGPVRTVPDPYDEDDAAHVDELPPFNGDAKASFAYDDGGRYKVESGDNYPSTRLIPEEKWRENWMPEREGVGEECAGCGQTIEWDAIIVNSEYHLRCYVGTEADRNE